MGLDRTFTAFSTLLLLKKLHSALNQASEEFLQQRLNIIKSVDGRIYIGNGSFIKEQKNNTDKS